VLEDSTPQDWSSAPCASTASSASSLTGTVLLYYCTGVLVTTVTTILLY